MKTKEDIRKNSWEEKSDIQEVIQFIQDNNDWTWLKNSQCKYISLRFDMRSGHFVILDRTGERITLEQLKYQNNGEADERKL